METIGADLRQMQRTPLAAAHVDALRAAGKVVNYPAGTLLARPGEPTDRFVYVEEGEIEVDSIEPIGFPDITPQLARESGFLGLIDLLKVAKHGKGENIYLVRFHYLPPGGWDPPPGRP